MAATKPRNLKPLKDFTHTLSITLGGPLFQSQFQTSRQRFQNQVSKIIPEKAFYPPEVYTSLHFGKLYLDTGTNQRVTEFSKVLHGLDYHTLLSRAVIESGAHSSSSSSPTRTPSHIPPLKISLRGLTTTSPDPSDAITLHIPPIDPTNRLQRFWHALADAFSTAGFPILGLKEPSVRFVSTLLMHWGVPRRHVISSRGEKKYKKLPPLPAFDAGRFIREYEDEVWATDVRLERLCLCELGGLEELADGGRVHKLRREVDSVALP